MYILIVYIKFRKVNTTIVVKTYEIRNISLFINRFIDILNKSVKNTENIEI